jgi:hypothetical protein
MHDNNVAIANTTQCSQNIDFCLPVGFIFFGIVSVLCGAKITGGCDKFKKNQRDYECIFKFSDMMISVY